jgi:dTDP-glucose 4,6-dehydratase
MAQTLPAPGLALPSREVEEVVQALSDLWSELRGSRFFVTGATGFFGRWFLEALLVANRTHDARVEIIALSRDPAGFIRKNPYLGANPSLRWVQGTVTTLRFEEIAASLGRARLQCDTLVHLATEADNAATVRDPSAATAVIADGTRRALEFAVKAGVKRMLFTSSGSVCARGISQGELLTEEHPATKAPLDSQTAYGISGAAKRTAEALCAEYAAGHGLGVSIARCFTFAGPGMPVDGKFAFGNFLRDALAGRRIVINGDGRPVRSYLYASDLTRWLLTILLRGAAGRSYNVGSESSISVRELAEAVIRETGSTVEIDVRGQGAPAAAADFYVPSTARARRELGLSEQIVLAETIRRSAAWLRPFVQH